MDIIALIISKLKQKTPLFVMPYKEQQNPNIYITIVFF